MEEVNEIVLNIYLFIFLDEVGAIVFDSGSYSFRAGYGGEESPKVFIIKILNKNYVIIF